MPNWSDTHLEVIGLSDEQNELLRQAIIENLSEGENKDA